jgi:hypothetical protein
MREGCEKGFFVSFDYSSDALQEIESFFKRSHKVIVALTDLICTSSLNPAFSPRRRRIVRRPLENSRAGICRTVNQITETVIAKSSPRLVAP